MRVFAEMYQIRISALLDYTVTLFGIGYYLTRTPAHLFHPPTTPAFVPLSPTSCLLTWERSHLPPWQTAHHLIRSPNQFLTGSSTMFSATTPSYFLLVYTSSSRPLQACRHHTPTPTQNGSAPRYLEPSRLIYVALRIAPPPPISRQPASTPHICI